MQKLLIKLFIKNKDDLNNPDVRRSYGTLASIFGIVSNLLVSALKIVFGVLFSLISLVADGMNNLTDGASSLISLIGFKLSSKPADKDHPFGHARIEYLTGFIVSFLVALVGLELIITSIEKILLFEPPLKDEKTFIISLIVLIISILIKLYQCLFNLSIGKKIKSTSLIATASDSRNDVISTAVILLGLIISYFFHINLDGYLGTLVGLFILISGFKLIIETADPLLGQKPDKELVKSLVNIITSHNMILGIHDLQVHSYGPNLFFASLHVEVDASLDILLIHDEIDNIEKECFEKLSINTVIHMDPVVLNDPYTDKVHNDFINIINKFDMNLSIHDFRIVKGPTHTNVLFDIVVPHDKKIKDEKLKELIQEYASEINKEYICVIGIDQDYSDFLSQEE